MANYAAFGAVLEQFNTTDGYVTVAQVADIQMPALALETPDVTGHDASDAWHIGVGGLKDIGEMTLELIFDPAAASHVSQWTLMSNRDYTVFRMTLPDAGDTTWAWRAFVTNFEPGAPVGERLTASVTMQGTGDPKIESDFVFLVDDVGDYLVDDLGHVLIEA